MKKGSHHSKEAIYKLREHNWSKRGFPHPFLGRHHSKETKNKLRMLREGKSYEEIVKLKSAVEWKKKLSEVRTGHEVLEATKKKISFSHIGEDNPNWKGGIDRSFCIRIAKKNFKNICMKCKKMGEIGRTNGLEVHHKNGIRKDNRIKNIMILCRSCHTKIHNQIN